MAQLGLQKTFYDREASTLSQLFTLALKKLHVVQLTAHAMAVSKRNS